MNVLIEKIIGGKKAYIITILILASFFSLWNKGKHDLQEWDESRNGVNAYEMLQNKDYVNFYYNGKLDTWNAKPPLMIWLITISYKTFGFNEFALRFPSTLSSFLFLVLCFYTIKLLESDLIAFLACLILISTKAIFGNHIGLTGDFDSLLILFLTASVYTFILYLEKQKKLAIYLTALFIGLAFYTKGPASLVLIPGFTLYIFFRGKAKAVFKDKNFWVSVVIFILIACSWFLLSFIYGKTTTQSVYGSKNSIETMLIHDTFKRLTTPDFDHFGTNKRSLTFFFEVLDSRLNLWNYLFYLSMFFGLYFCIKNRQSVFVFLKVSSRRFTLLALCLIIPLSLVLTLSLNQHNWYLAPVFMFIAFLTSKGIVAMTKKWKPLYFITVCLLVFTLLRQFHYIYSQKTTLHDALTRNEILKDKSVMVVGKLKQDLLLYLKWLSTNVSHQEAVSPDLLKKGELILIDKNQMDVVLQNNVFLLQQVDDYYLGVIK